MKKITSTGDGMSVLIVCDYSPHHDWMAFASWYSFSKMLPDAQVGILCNRKPFDWQMFSWARKCRVKMRIHAPMTKDEQVRFSIDNKFLDTPLIVVEPEVVMLRGFTDEDVEFFQKNPLIKSNKVWVVSDPSAESVDSDLCCNVKEDKISTFASYPDGWGKFVTSSWINKASSPFQHSFGRGGMTSNEVKVDKLWKQLSLLFQTVSRG